MWDNVVHTKDGYSEKFDKQGKWYKATFQEADDGWAIGKIMLLKSKSSRSGEVIYQNGWEYRKCDIFNFQDFIFKWVMKN